MFSLAMKRGVGLSKSLLNRRQMMDFENYSIRMTPKSNAFLVPAAQNSRSEHNKTISQQMFVALAGLIGALGSFGFATSPIARLQGSDDEDFEDEIVQPQHNVKSLATKTNCPLI